MEQKIHGSPLSRICYQDSTYLLEALLPFVPPMYKLPLAIMIKWSELQRIVHVFQDPALLNRYGLSEPEFSMEAFGRQMENCPNKQLAESILQMGQMLQMTQMMQMMNEMQDVRDIHAEKTDTYEPTDNEALGNEALDNEPFDIEQFIQEVFS